MFTVALFRQTKHIPTKTKTEFNQARYCICREVMTMPCLTRIRLPCLACRISDKNARHGLPYLRFSAYPYKTGGRLNIFPHGYFQWLNVSRMYYRKSRLRSLRYIQDECQISLCNSHRFSKRGRFIAFSLPTIKFYDCFFVILYFLPTSKAYIPRQYCGNCYTPNTY